MKIHVLLVAGLILLLQIVPGAADDSQEAFNSAGALYSRSVDLANEGKYQEALDAADKALAMNVTSLTGVIQSNRAGILVMQQRYNEAITAADAALAQEGNLTTTHSVAWYNKGNALRALGRIADAQTAYAKAYALDNTLVPPDMSADIPVTSAPDVPLSPSVLTPVSPTANPPLSPTRKSPLSVFPVLVVLGVFSGMVSIFRKK
jgi:tetratricopeptide (TPR) repeat protein